MVDGSRWYPTPYDPSPWWNLRGRGGWGARRPLDHRETKGPLEARAPTERQEPNPDRHETKPRKR